MVTVFALEDEMIGGYDILLEGKSTTNDIDLVLRFFRAIWGNGVVESPGQWEKTPITSLSLFPVPWLNELFIYQNIASFISCEKNGVTPENKAAIVWILFGSNEITFVIDDIKSKTGVLIQELITAIKINRNTFTKL